MRRPLPLALVLLGSAAACAGTPATPPLADASLDVRETSGGDASDVPSAADAGDAGPADASAPDAGDAGTTDASATDAGATDAGASDAGTLAFVQVSAGSTGHACAVRSDGTLWCWGLNDHGQLGRAPAEAATRCAVRGSSPAQTIPCDPRARRTTSFDDVAQVAVGNGTTCVRRRDGSVWCFGLNDAGELGQGSGASGANPTPVRVTLPGAATDVALGAFHACAALSDGSVRCWGSNKFAQCGVAVASSPARCDEGDGTLSGCAPSPVAVPGITSARAVSLGRWHSCALLGDGSVRCWGLNDSAQLGTGRVDPETAPSATPVTPAVDRATAVSAGGSHTCALRDDNTLRCWGWGDLGQIAQAPTAACGVAGTTFQCALAPVALTAPTGVAGISAGRYHSCAFTSSGETRCFGRNDNGQLGATPSNAETCLAVPDRFPCLHAPSRVEVSPVASISVGDYHSCAVTRSGEVRCWGWNQFGQVGDGTTDDRASPTLLVRAD